MNSPSQQVARRRPEPPALEVEDLMRPIISLTEALAVSEVLSQSDMVPRSLYGKPSNVFHVIMTGQALGLHWTEAVRVIFSPGPGQIGMRAQFLLYQVRKAGHRYTITPGRDSCTVKIKRGDTEEEFESTFTIEDAIQGGLVKRKDDGTLVALSRDGKPLPWMQWDKKMLRWRAVTDVVSFGVPEAGMGFQVEEDSAPEPPPEVQLRPESPAPSGPAGQAAAGDGQAVQAELKELDEKMRSASPEVGGNPPDAAEDEGDEMGAAGTEPRLPEDEPTAEDEAGTPDDTSAKAKAGLLREWFAKCGYDPREYPGRVRHACSVYVKRRIVNMGGLRAAEVMSLSNELSALYRKQDELAPVSRLADKISGWEESWRAEDPAGFAAYEEAIK